MNCDPELQITDFMYVFSLGHDLIPHHTAARWTLQYQSSRAEILGFLGPQGFFTAAVQLKVSCAFNRKAIATSLKWVSFT